jgi:hypothetical protein
MTQSALVYYAIIGAKAERERMLLESESTDDIGGRGWMFNYAEGLRMKIERLEQMYEALKQLEKKGFGFSLLWTEPEPDQ